MTETWRTAVHQRSRGGRRRLAWHLRRLGRAAITPTHCWPWGGTSRPPSNEGGRARPWWRFSSPCGRHVGAGPRLMGASIPREAGAASRGLAPCCVCVVVPTRGREDHHADASMRPIPVYHQDASEPALPGPGKYYAAIAPLYGTQEGGLSKECFFEFASAELGLGIRRR